MSTVKNIIQNNHDYINKIHTQLSTKGGMPNVSLKEWFFSGVSCELLIPNKDWKKGQVMIKIFVEFCPDEPDKEESTEEIKKNISESPLDDIRKAITEEN